MENDRIAKRFYAWDYAVSPLVGRPRKRWTDTVKDCMIGVYGGGL